MAKKDTGDLEKPKVAEARPFPVFDPAEFGKLGNRNLEVATRAVRAYLNGATKLNQKMMGFMNTRAKKDIESAQNFMTSKSSEKAYHAQAEFIENAIRDYADEVSKLLNLAADMAKETLTPIEQRTEEVLHSIDEHAEQQDAAAE